jgi:uncharacterized protein involved in exopolysaccharide biosynthesis
MDNNSGQIVAIDTNIDLTNIIDVILQKKLQIILIIVVFVSISIYYAINLPNIYQSEALLSPVTEGSGMKIPGQLGGLAALAGVNLGAGGSGDKTNLAIEIIKSREFIGNFIEKNNLLPAIIAAQRWERNSDTLIYDPKLYDSEKLLWVREVKPPLQAKPSLLEAHEAFIKMLSISEDKNNGMIRIGFEHVSPILAKSIVDALIKTINNQMRVRELQEAEVSIAYLNKQLETTNISDVKTMLYSLIEEQTKKMMLANVRDEFVFKTIDAAVYPEKHEKPKRVAIVLAGLFTSLFLSLFVVYIVNYMSSMARK